MATREVGPDKYRELFESAPDGIFIADPSGIYTDVNAAGCRMLGYTREELIGRSITEFVPPGELARQAKLARDISEGGMEVSEWLLRRKDGTFLHAELSSNTLPDGHMRAFVRDVTERHRIEDALRLSEAKFSGIVSISADAIIAIDEMQRVTMFNEAAERIYGYSKDEILGTTLEALIPARFRDAHRRHIERFVLGQETSRRMGARRVPIFGLRKDGEEFQVSAAISKLEVGGTRLLIVSLHDISEEARAESEERLLAEVGRLLVTAGSQHERMLNDVADVVVRSIADWCAVDLVHAEGVRRVRVVHAEPTKVAVSDALERLRLDRPGSNPVRVALENRTSLLISEVTPDYIESIAENPGHLQLLRALEPTSFMVVPLVARAKALGTLAIGSSRGSRRFGLEDLAVAERLASSVALAVDNAQMHEALERALRARDEVLGIVAHDLRNPLNAIVLRVQGILRDRTEPERRDRTALESIYRSAMLMNRLIQDLLDVTRLEAGSTLPIDQSALSTTSLLVDMAEAHRVVAAKAGRALEVVTANDLPQVSADRIRVQQVFDNLVGNAVKFARSQITVGAEARDGEVLFSVANDGPGISAEDLPHVFDRFWQGSQGDRRGIGLGLSIVQAIVQAHRGRVWVESPAGAGTTFYFTLPRAKDEPSSHPSASGKSP